MPSEHFGLGLVPEELDHGHARILRHLVEIGLHPVTVEQSPAGTCTARSPRVTSTVSWAFGACVSSMVVLQSLPLFLGNYTTTLHPNVYIAHFWVGDVCLLPR